MRFVAKAEKGTFMTCISYLKFSRLKKYVTFFQKKYGDQKLILLFKSVVYFNDAENDEEPVLLKEKITWEQVKKNILKSVNIKM
jgi:hypothetical protein